MTHDQYVRCAAAFFLVGLVAIIEGIFDPRRRSWLILGTVCWLLAFEASQRASVAV